MNTNDQLGQRFERGASEINTSKKSNQDEWLKNRFERGAGELGAGSETGQNELLKKRFQAGQKTLEKESEGLLKKAGRSVVSLGPSFAAMGAGMVQYGAEAPLRKREEILSTLGILQREGAALPKKKVIPEKPIRERVKGMNKLEIFMESLEEQYGKQIKPIGKAIEYVRGTDPVKWLMEKGAKGDIAKAMLDKDLPAEAVKLIEEEKYEEAEKYLKDVEFTKHPELAQKYERDPLKKAIEVGGEKAILDPTIKGAAAFGKGARGLAEKIRPESRRGTAAYYVTGAIEGVGPMAITVAASIYAKKPEWALPMMFPQVLGQGYSADRAKGKSALDSAKENTFKALTAIASEATPIGIATKVGGKFITKTFKTGTAEGITETIDEAVNIAYEEGILDEHTPAHEIGKRLIDAQIIGTIGGAGMGAIAHPLSGKEADSPETVKKDIIDSITEVYEKGEQTAEQTVESLTEGYKNKVFDDTDLSKISKAHPDLKNGIDAMAESVRTGEIKGSLVGAIDEGLSSGEFQGEKFTTDNAVDLIKKGLDGNILATEDIDSLKDQFPQIKDELNTIIAENVIAEPEATITEPKVTEPEITEPKVEEYKDSDIEAIYKEAKERVRTEPVTLKELQDKFVERKGREATEKEAQELNRVYEKAKKRSEFIAKKEAKKIPPTKKEAEFEAYQPELPPSKPEVRTRKVEPTYPRGAKYVAGKEAPEGLAVEYKPALSTNNTPWKTQARALNALKNGRRFKAAGYTEETHEIVPVEGGFGIAKKAEVVEPKKIRPIIEASEHEVTESLLKKAEKTGFTSRDEAIKVAGAIATLDKTNINAGHIAEAIQLFDQPMGWTKSGVDGLKRITESDTMPKEFKERASGIMATLQGVVKPAKKTIAEKRLEKEAGKRRSEDVGLLKETSEIATGVTLDSFIDTATKDSAKAVKIIKGSTVSKNKIIEGLRNKGLAAIGRASKSERTEMKKNLSATLDSILKDEPVAETRSRLLENIKSEKGSSELINDLSRLGADALRRGHTKLKDFSAQMKSELGNVWEKIKPLIRRAYIDAKRILKSERGMLGGMEAAEPRKGSLHERPGIPEGKVAGADIRYPKKEKVDLNKWADDLIAGAFKKDVVEGTTEIEVADKTEGISYKDTQGKTTSKDYDTNRKMKKGNVIVKGLRAVKKVGIEIVEGVDKYLGSISTRAGNISPKIKAKIRALDFNINIKYNKDVKVVKGMLDKVKKSMSKDDFADWDLARKNSDIDKINELVKKYNIQKEYALYRKTLDDIRSEAIDVGLSIGEIEEYAPRILKDSEGFLAAIGKDIHRPYISDQLKQRAADLKTTVAEMPRDQKADIVSNIILGKTIGLGGIPSTKQRKIEKVSGDLNQYYMDSDAALMQHLYSMRKGIEARKFFGKIPEKVAKIRTELHATQANIRKINETLKTVKDQGEIDKLNKRKNELIGNEKELTACVAKYLLQRDYTENIGSYVMELVTSGEISAKDEGVLTEILTARFHEVGTRGLIQSYKNISYIDTMGSPTSALTQIGDLAWSMYEGGVIRTLKNAFKSATGKSRITKADVGVDRIAQEFADAGTLSKAVTMVFKAVGLEKMDAIGKESLMNSALEKYQKQAKKDPSGLKKQISSIFENETDSVIEDLLNNEISENVKLLVYSRLLDFQPVGLSEMPQKYLDAGNGRLFYMLKTFTIKAFDVFRNEAYYKIKNGDRSTKIQGMKNLAKLAMYFVLCNAGADELKDLLLGRKTELSDRLTDNILRLFGISKFVTWKARTEGVGSALIRQILPPFKLIDSLGKDVITVGDEKGLEMLGSVPVVGKLAYWHLGRGTKKREDLWARRLRTKRAKLKKIKEGLDKAEDRDTYRSKHWEELSEYREVQAFQSKVNKRTKEINKLKSKPESAILKKLIQKKEQEKTELVRDFMKSDEVITEGKSIWAGVRGTTEHLDTTQKEIVKLVRAEVLKESRDPGKSIHVTKNIDVDLSDAQHKRYVNEVNTEIKNYLDRATSSSKWSTFSDKKKVYIIKRIIKKKRKYVRDMWRRKIITAKRRERRNK